MNRELSETENQIILMSWCKKVAQIFSDEAGGFFCQRRRDSLDSIFHIANGGSRSAREGVMFKAMGVKKGVSDLFMPGAGTGGEHGLWIEMKATSGRLSCEQGVWLGRMKQMQYGATEAHSWRIAADKIMEYLGGEWPDVDMTDQIGRLVGTSGAGG